MKSMPVATSSANHTWRPFAKRNEIFVAIKDKNGLELGLWGIWKKDNSQYYWLFSWINKHKILADPINVVS